MSSDEDLITTCEHDLGKEEMTLESKQDVSIDMECCGEQRQEIGYDECLYGH